MQKPILIDAWHGTKERFERFDPAHAADGHARLGCGFYFTSSRDDARTYAGEDGRLLKVRLTIRRELSTKGVARRDEVEKLMRGSPEFEDVLQNWDERPGVAFSASLRSVMSAGPGPRAVMEQVWYDFYRNSPEAFMQNMTALGYDGFQEKLESGVVHTIMFNVNAVEILAIQEVGHEVTLVGSGSEPEYGP